MFVCTLVRIIIITLVLAGCERQASDYFPLEENLVYEYSILQTVNAEIHQARLIIANLPAISTGDEIFYPRRTAAGTMLYFQKRPGGIYYLGDPGVAGHIILKYPLLQNTTWRSASDVYVLKNRHESFAGGEAFISLGGMLSLNYRIAGLHDLVQTPAGRFENCVRVEASGSMRVEERTRGITSINIEQTEWYAPDIGLVKMTRKEYTIPEKIKAEMVQELLEIRRP